MTEAEFSRHRKVSRALVHDWEGQGLLVMRGTAVDVEASDAVLDARPASYRGGTASSPIGNGTTPDTAPINLAEASRRKEWALAKLREHELLVKRRGR